MSGSQVRETHGQGVNYLYESTVVALGSVDLPRGTASRGALDSQLLTLLSEVLHFCKIMWFNWITRPSQSIMQNSALGMPRCLSAALSITAWLSLAACTTSSQQKDLILGIQGAGGLTETERQFKPLADHLSQRLSRNVKIEAMPSFQAGMISIKTREYAIAKLGPYAYANLPVNSGYKLFAGESSKGLPYYYSVFIARADSNIKELSDARGKRVALGDPLSASQSVLINRELASLGLSAGAGYTVVRLDNHKAILNALASNKADIGSVSSRFLPKILATNPSLFSDLVVIGNSRRIPNDAWGIDSTLPSELKSKIEDAFFSLDDTNVTGEIENIDLFRNASDDEYSFLRTTPGSAKK